MANQVKLSFTGDTTSVQKAYSDVGSGAKRMEKDVGDAWENAAEKSDTADTRAMGFRDTLTGIQDGATGIKRAASGDWGFETLLLLGTGFGDLASGLTNFIIPAMKGFTGAVKANTIAMLSSPITWIIVGIVALVAVIVLIATKTDWFQRLWKWAWGGIKSAAVAVWDWLKQVPGWIGTAFGKVAGFITAPYRLGFRLARQAGQAAWDWLKQVPGWVGSAFGRIAGFITAPFRAGFNLAARAWNNTIGRLSWTVPGWVPGIGGNSISVPRLPTFHSGGVVPGLVGQPVPIMALGGERVSGLASRDAGTIRLGSDGSRMGDALIGIIRAAVQSQGGDPSVLGIR
jgi:hypothetical protein